MKKLVILLLSVVVLGSCTQPQKIGYVNTEKLIQDYQGTKDAEAILKKKQADAQKQMQSLGQAFDAKIKKMSQREQRKNYESLMKEQQQLQQLNQQMQYQLQAESQKSIEKVSKTVNDFVKEYAKTNKYNFILGTVNVNGAVMYGDESADVTYDVLKALNNKYTNKSSDDKKVDDKKAEGEKKEDTKEAKKSETPKEVKKEAKK